ncbi:MAG: cation diffusion facilitator family transporter [FCB group bacterium]|nr:cation diffusion facilitator family transporter [FCB group bacterium]
MKKAKSDLSGKINTIHPETYALREGAVSLIANILLFGLKLWAGIRSASAAMIADAWHTLSDSISSLIIMISARISRKAPDREHPFGHGRAELIASLLVGFLLVFISVDFFLEGIRRLIEQTPANYGTIAIAVTSLSLVFKEAMAQYALWGFRRTGFLTLKADAWHHRSDALSSLVILIGIFIGRYMWWADGVLTLIVSIMIAHTAITIISDGIKPLLGESPDKELLQYLSRTCDELAGIKTHVHHVHLHRYGRHVELTFHLELPSELTLREAHERVTKIERYLKKEKQFEATIHMEPKSKD